MKPSCDTAQYWNKTSGRVFLAVFGLALIFAVFTGHAWEDYYITFRASKNLATGNGLVFTPGQKLHTFTSPLGVLLPAALSFLTGNQSEQVALWLFRIISAAAFGAAAVFLLRIARANALTLWPALLLVGLFGLDAKTVDFSINRMETAFMMIFLALTLDAFNAASSRPALKLGAAWAGLMWTRPDSFIYIGGLGLGALIFNAVPWVQDRKAVLKLCLKAALVTTAIYLPWILWATWYYGTPVPHTIIAKGLGNPPFDPIAMVIEALVDPAKLLPWNTTLKLTFSPPYFNYGGWPFARVIGIYSSLISLLCALYWCVRSANPLARIASFAFMIGHIYLTKVVSVCYLWYVPTTTLLATLVCAHMFEHLLAKFRKRSPKPGDQGGNSPGPARILKYMAGSMVGLQFVFLVGVAFQMRYQQRWIEYGLRKPIGLWLREHAATPQDTVYLEPLGYIGYFSQLKMYDYPGLCSPEVVAARRKLEINDHPNARLIDELKPDWLVLRPFEFANELRDPTSIILTDYRSVAKFDASDKVNAAWYLPGRGYLEYDKTFVIFKRVRPAQSSWQLPVSDPAVQRVNSGGVPKL